MDRTEEEIQQDNIRHKAKHDELDKMRDKQRQKAERMERINPKELDHPILTVEEVEAIEKDLPEGDFTDADIIDAITRKVPQKRGPVEKMINARKVKK